MKSETKVVLSIAIAFAGLESVARVVEPVLSADVRNMREHRKIPDMMRKDEQEGRTTCLVVGNSLARAGIRPEEFTSFFSEHREEEVELYFLAPDASGINEWVGAFRKYFLESTVQPDFVFVITGPDHISDQPVRSVEKLSAFHVGSGDRWMVFRDWLESGNERAKFVLAAVSRLVANRERLRPLVFYHLIPGYEEVAHRRNSEGKEQAQPEFSEAGVQRLRLLMESIDETKSRTFIVTVPMSEPYVLPDSVYLLAKECEIPIVDAYSDRNWPAAVFIDGYHLTEAGGRRFTSELLEEIFSEGVERNTANQEPEFKDNRREILPR